MSIDEKYKQFQSREERESAARNEAHAAHLAKHPGDDEGAREAGRKAVEDDKK